MIYFYYHINLYQEGKSDINKYNTLFGQLLSFIPGPEFERLCRNYGADKYCKGFSAGNELAVMIFAQITDQNGLRSTANALNSLHSAFYHTRLKDNADYKVVKRRKTYSGRITSDQIIKFTGLVSEKKCPCELRRIRSIDKKQERVSSFSQTCAAAVLQK